MYEKGLTKSFIIVLSFALAANIAYKFYKRRKMIKVAEITDVIMFPGEVRKSKNSRFMIFLSTEKLIYYLSSPKHSIDICMYVFTDVDIANAIVKLHFRGIKIRIIVNDDKTLPTDPTIKRLLKLGIAVRQMKSRGLMHHKFCLIDVNNTDVTPFVMSGSLNWTSQALQINYENVMVTSQKDIVQIFISEFENMWTFLKPKTV